MTAFKYGFALCVLLFCPAGMAYGQDKDAKKTAPALSKAEFLKQAQERFSKLDKDFNGELTKEEIQAKHVARRKKMSRETFKRFDHDQNGYLTLNEFEAETEKNTKSREERLIKRAEKQFDKIDTDRNGVLSRDEYLATRAKTLVKQREKNKHYLSLAFKRLDLDGDGIISEGEYVDQKGRHGQTPEANKSFDLVDSLPPNNSRAKVKHQDANKDKKVTRFENDRFQESFFDYFDVDNNDELSAKERKKMRNLRFMDKTL